MLIQALRTTTTSHQAGDADKRQGARSRNNLAVG